jgi:hypothetical protein
MNTMRWMSTLVMLVMLVSLSGITPVKAQEVCDSNGMPSVSTDQDDYALFETVTITGSGFGCGETLFVQVSAPDGGTLSGDGTGAAGPDAVVTDENGGFELLYQLSGAGPSRSTRTGLLLQFQRNGWISARSTPCG